MWFNKSIREIHGILIYPIYNICIQYENFVETFD